MTVRRVTASLFKASVAVSAFNAGQLAQRIARSPVFAAAFTRSMANKGDCTSGISILPFDISILVSAEPRTGVKFSF